MNALFRLLSGTLIVAGACFVSPTPGRAADDLAPLSDEFGNARTLRQWQRVNRVEGWNMEQLERLDINDSVKGTLTMMPYTSGWYQEYRGVLMFKEVAGDFVASTRLRVTNRAGDAAPGAQYSLGGLMVRAPRAITPATWAPGGENYIFLSMGATGDVGQYSFEMKTTRASDSQLTTRPMQGPDAELRLVRVGATVITLGRSMAGGPWQVLGRYNRPDLPRTVQVGMTAYTDWTGVAATQVQDHNRRVIRNGNPDLLVHYDYVRYARPVVPAALANLNLASAAAVSDEALIAAFTTPAVVPADPAAVPTVPAAPAADVPAIPPPGGLRDVPVPPLGAAAIPGTPPVGAADAAPGQASARQAAADAALAALSDDFDNARNLRAWKRIYQTEGYTADQLRRIDVDTTRKGKLFLEPLACVWYQDYRGPMLYKDVTGDFVATMSLAVNRPDGGGAPRSSYALCGLMVRSPRTTTMRTWTPGGENYIFLSLGSARNPGQYQFEVKTTVNSVSRLDVDAGTPSSLLRCVRVGDAFVLLRKPEGANWQVHRRYTRPDMPNTLQVGVTIYADYVTGGRLQPVQQNNTRITNGNPDMVAEIDYVHYRRPQLPADWLGRDLADPRAVSDADLLRVFGQD